MTDEIMETIDIENLYSLLIQSKRKDDYGDFDAFYIVLCKKYNNKIVYDTMIDKIKILNADDNKVQYKYLYNSYYKTLLIANYKYIDSIKHKTWSESLKELSPIVLSIASILASIITF